MFVAGGFAEVTPERCTVLADEVLIPADLSREEGERRLAEAEEALAQVDGFGRRGARNWRWSASSRRGR